MTDREAMELARACVKDVTPLNGDCGKICSAACCQTLDGDDTGMLLFPGEEPFYTEAEGWRILSSPLGKIAVCPGHCERSERPLSCRIFPLIPLLRDGGIRIAMDRRARAVCPLVQSGLSGVTEVFREAVREAGRLLASSEGGRRCLKLLTEQQDEIKALEERLSLYGNN